MIQRPLAACCVAICLTGVVACHGGQAGVSSAPARSGHVVSTGTPGASATAPASRPGTPAAPASGPLRPASSQAGPAGCGTGPARRAWVMDVAMSGVPRWDRRLRTDPTQSGVAVQPLVLGDTAVFAEENAVYALRLSDGRLLWRRSFAAPRANLWSTMVYGLWGWRGTVAALVGQASPGARLVSLDAATGAVRWTLALSRQGVTGTLTPTGDGGLAMVLSDGSLTVADLGTGALRWTRPGQFLPGPVAVGGVLAAAASGAGSSGGVAGYDTKTGRLLWTRHGMPAQPQLLVAAGRLVVYTNTQNVSPRPAVWPVTALSPSTGRTLWRAATAGPVGAVSASTQSARAGGVAVATADPDELYLIDPGTGRVRWHRASDVNSDATPLVTGTDVVYVSDSGRGAALGGERLADLRASDGSVRWAAPLADSVFLPEPVLAFGPYLVVSLGSGQRDDPARLVAYRAATGAIAWTARVPTLVQVPPAVVGRHLLVQPTDPAVACPAEGSAARLFLAEHRLRLDLDLDLLADHDPAGDRRVEAHAEVVPVDLGGRGEPGPGPAVRVRPEAVDLHVQRHRLRHAPDGQVAGHLVLVSVRRDAGGLERHCRVVRGVQEALRAQVLVALLVARIDRGRVNGDGDGGVERVVGGDKLHVELGELAPDLAHHQVAGHEPDVRVNRVQVPGARHIARYLGRHHFSSRLRA
jgi:outer membrane protein assembly factor BamB